MSSIVNTIALFLYTYKITINISQKQLLKFLRVDINLVKSVLKRYSYKTCSSISVYLNYCWFKQTFQLNIFCRIFFLISYSIISHKLKYLQPKLFPRHGFLFIFRSSAHIKSSCHKFQLSQISFCSETKCCIFLGKTSYIPEIFSGIVFFHRDHRLQIN